MKVLTKFPLTERYSSAFNFKINLQRFKFIENKLIKGSFRDYLFLLRRILDFYSLKLFIP